jgi:7-cyano-7-deazaguanine synthase
LAALATKAGVEGTKFRIHAPLLHLTKAEIIRCGQLLGLDYGITVSCYQADLEGRACGRCDACRLRTQGFLTAEIHDPTLYVS